MFQMLMVASGEWEKKQQLSLKETGSRQWRVVEATKCILELEALVKVRRLLCEDWSWLPTARTCKLLSTIFRFVARTGAAICQLLIVRRIGCPYRVFALLEDASMVDSVLSTRRCCLDEWSHHLLQEHGRTAEQVRGCEFMARLESIALMLTLDTVSTERLHAANQAHTRKRAALRALNLADLAAFVTVKSFSKTNTFKKTKTKDQHRENADDPDGPPSKRPRITAWNAFMSMRTSQTQQAQEQGAFARSTQQLQLEWRGLSEEQKAYYRTVAKGMQIARGNKKRKHKSAHLPAPASFQPTIASTLQDSH